LVNSGVSFGLPNRVPQAPQKLWVSELQVRHFGHWMAMLSLRLKRDKNADFACGSQMIAN
jgi:hypothetical protein